MKRLAIFAHFDKKNIIDDCVLFYVEQLKKHCETVLFMSLSDLNEQEQAKLDNVILIKHDEYDFGSYKRGFQIAKEKGFLDDVDEILFVNDSTYCINSLDKVFETEYNSDFWGIIENKYGFRKVNNKLCFAKPEPHLQSWFLGFRRNVFTSKVFEEFLNNIKVENSKNEIILNYEIGLTKTLVAKGFTYNSFNKNYAKSYNPSIYYWRELVKDGVPFVKRSIMLGINRDKTTIENFEEVIENKTVLEFVKPVKINHTASIGVKFKMYDILRTSNDIQRRVLTKVLKTFCPFLFD